MTNTYIKYDTIEKKHTLNIPCSPGEGHAGMAWRAPGVQGGFAREAPAEAPCSRVKRGDGFPRATRRDKAWPPAMRTWAGA